MKGRFIKVGERRNGDENKVMVLEGGAIVAVGQLEHHLRV